MPECFGCVWKFQLGFTNETEQLLRKFSVNSMWWCPFSGKSRPTCSQHLYSIESRPQVVVSDWLYFNLVSYIVKNEYRKPSWTLERAIFLLNSGYIIIFFCLDFLSQTEDSEDSREGGGYLFNLFLPLPPTLHTLRH